MHQTNDVGCCRQIFRVLTIITSVSVDSKVFMQNRVLQKYLADNGLTDVVKPGGQLLTLKHAKVRVKAISAGIEPLEFRSKVEREMRFNLVVQYPDTLFNITNQQRRDQAVIEANDAARRQTATLGDAMLVAAPGAKLYGNAADEPDRSQSANTAGVKAERKRQYEYNECFVYGSEVAGNRTAPKAGRTRRGKAFICRATARIPRSSSISNTSSNPQAVPLSIPGATPPGWPLRLPPLHLVLVGTRPPRKRWLRESNLLRLRRLRRKMTTTCTFACRGRR